MPFTLERFCEVRPYLFHLTAQGNLNRLLDTRTLQPASELLAICGWSASRIHPRAKHQPVEIDSHVVWIRDQKPLKAGHIDFEDGWDLPRLLALIDSHVFFWPGSETGPRQAGLNHFTRYERESPAVVRSRTGDLFEANPDLAPLFCRFNSGAPTTVHGRKSPRGSKTYITAHDSAMPPGDVQEVVFAHSIRLPQTTEVATSYGGPWTPFYDRRRQETQQG